VRCTGQPRQQGECGRRSLHEGGLHRRRATVGRACARAASRALRHTPCPCRQSQRSPRSWPRPACCSARARACSRRTALSTHRVSAPGCECPLQQVKSQSCAAHGIVPPNSALAPTHLGTSCCRPSPSRARVPRANRSTPTGEPPSWGRAAVPSTLPQRKHFRCSPRRALQSSACSYQYRTRAGGRKALVRVLRVAWIPQARRGRAGNLAKRQRLCSAERELDGPYGANSTLSGLSSAEPIGRAREAAACLAGGVLADVLAVNVAEVHERLVQHRVRAGYAYLMCTAHACMRFLSCGAECARVHARACVYAYVRVCMCACVRACDRWVVCSAVQCSALQCIA
jgi:hypothetical protein